MRRLNALTFKQLRALEAVCAEGSITHATEALALTPPAVHSALKALEENFGCALLRRTQTGAFAATAEGSALLAAWAKSQAALGRAVREIDALQRGAAGVVELGVVSTGKYFAPGIVAALKDAHPGIEMRLRVGNRDDIVAELAAEKIDLAVMGRPPRIPPVVAEGLGDHPHVLIAHPRHPLAGRPGVGADEILAEHVILREEGSGTRILAMRFLDQLGEGRLYDHTEMGSNETIKQAVIAGLGIALISAHTVIEELKAGRLAMIPGPGLPIFRQWFVLHRADHEIGGAVATALDFIIAHRERLILSREVEAAIGARR